MSHSNPDVEMDVDSVIGVDKCAENSDIAPGYDFGESERFSL
jgi:hypothetical protein